MWWLPALPLKTFRVQKTPLPHMTSSMQMQHLVFANSLMRSACSKQPHRPKQWTSQELLMSVWAVEIGGHLYSRLTLLTEATRPGMSACVPVTMWVQGSQLSISPHHPQAVDLQTGKVSYPDSMYTVASSSRNSLGTRWASPLCFYSAKFILNFGF